MAANPPDVCPVCGEDVPAGARACPECGADENSGWNTDDAIYDGLDLPDEGFDAEPSQPSLAVPTWFWQLTAGVLVLAFILWLLRSL